MEDVKQQIFPFPSYILHYGLVNYFLKSFRQ